LNAAALISLTNSGNSARELAKYRPSKPIYAITHNDKVHRQLTLSWGVVPAFSIKKSSISQTLKDVINKGLKKSILDEKKTYILTAGSPMGVSGSTNVIRVLTSDGMGFFKNLNT